MVSVRGCWFDVSVLCVILYRYWEKCSSKCTSSHLRLQSWIRIKYWCHASSKLAAVLITGQNNIIALFLLSSLWSSTDFVSFSLLAQPCLDAVADIDYLHVYSKYIRGECSAVVLTKAVLHSACTVGFCSSDPSCDCSYFQPAHLLWTLHGVAVQVCSLHVHLHHGAFPLDIVKF